MTYRDSEKCGSGLRARSLRRGSAILACIAAIAGGCNRDEALDAFRSGASDQLQAGIQAISSGVINGAFAAFDLKNGDSGDSNTSGATAETSTTDATTDTSGETTTP